MHSIPRTRRCRVWFRKGVAQRHRGEAAAPGLTAIFSLRRPEKFASVDQGIYGHVTRKSAELARERGDHQEAEALWRAILAECPADKGCALEPERRRRLACRRTSTKLNRHGPTTGRTDCRCGKRQTADLPPKNAGSIWERHLSKYVNPPVQDRAISEKGPQRKHRRRRGQAYEDACARWGQLTPEQQKLLPNSIRQTSFREGL